MPDPSLFPKEYVQEAPARSAIASFFVASAYFFLIIALAAWGGLYFYKNSLREEISGLESQIQASPLQGKTSEIRKIKSMEKLLDNFSGLLKGHIHFSNIFRVIEGYTLKTVFLNKASINIKDSSVNISGIVGSYKDFAKQLGKFKSSPDIVKKADIESLKFSRVGIEFSIKLLLNEDIWPLTIKK